MDNKIVIYPKTKYLSPSELITQRNVPTESLRNGLKKTTPLGTPEESEELDRIYGELERQLSIPRIDRLAGRSQGEWDFEHKAVKILQKEGKFNVFGYSLNGDIYLEPYEALFLLELNRIDILYCSMTMSIEQGYLLLLGEEESLNYKNYLVYSMFSRIGYIVQKYQNTLFTDRPATVDDCIWSLLENSIHDKRIPDPVRQSEYFQPVENSMSDIRRKIMNQESHQEEPKDNNPILLFGKKLKATGKRKLDLAETSNPKRARYDYESPREQKSFIDMLTNEEDYKKFEDLFQSFDIVKLKGQFDYEESNAIDLDIQFDVHLHSEHFKKSEPKRPAFRLAILNGNQAFPNRSTISKCYHKQQQKVPVLVVSVSANLGPTNS